jgi:hypothetical protein
MNDENIIVASLMKMMGLGTVKITKEMAENIKGYVIVHKDIDDEYRYTLEYKEGE